MYSEPRPLTHHHNDQVKLIESLILDQIIESFYFEKGRLVMFWDMFSGCSYNKPNALDLIQSLQESQIENND